MVVHVLHIGKTGGTAIKQALGECGRTTAGTIHLHNHDVTLRDIPQGERVVFFLRDPVRRFVSAFYSRQRQGAPRYHAPWSAAEKDVFETFTTPNKLATALSASDDIVKRRASHAMRSVEHIRDSYWKWFGNDEYFLSRIDDIFFVGFQESLSDDFSRLKRLLKLPKAIRLPRDDIRAHRNPRGLDTVLTEEATGNLRRWYKADYEFIDLCSASVPRISGGTVDGPRPVD